MRDYQQYFFTTDDTPFAYSVIAMNYFFQTRDACDNFIADNPVSPGGGKLSATLPIWFRLDKAITLGYINAAALTNLGTADSPIFSGSKQMIYFESPRKFGVNSLEEKRASVGAGDSGASGRGGTLNISLKGYLLLLLNTWGGGVRLKSGQFLVQPAPQRWIEWLTLLISHFDRYTATQIYGLLARVDFTGPTFKV